MSQFVTDTSSGSCVNSRAVAMSQSRDCANYLIIPHPSRAAVNRGLNAFPVSVTRWAFWVYSWVIEPKKPDRHHQTTRLKQPAAQRLWSNLISIKPKNGIVFERYSQLFADIYRKPDTHNETHKNTASKRALSFLPPAGTTSPGYLHFGANRHGGFPASAPWAWTTATRQRGATA